MKNKTSSFIVNWHIFPFDVMVCLGTDQEETLKILEKYYLTDEDREHVVMTGNGKTVMFSGGETLLWLRKYPTPGNGNLAHECFHAVFFLLDKVGITIDTSSDELVAYMLGYLSDEIHKKL